MKIKKLKFLEGAQKAQGLTVIIDVFRAYTTAAYLFSKKANEIFIVSQIKTAKNLKKKLEAPILIGERQGIKLKEFDFNNSPFFISRENFFNKEIILSTSAGTKGIIAAENADKILTGSFVNLKATADYIKNQNPAVVSLVAMGNNGTTKADEDELYAQELEKLLKGKETLTQNQIKDKLRSPAGDRFFNKKTQSEMPKEDFEYCLKINKFNFIIEAVKKENDIYQLKRKAMDE
ncbi:2-phosphosulfolactate phosphatase [Halanaerobium praevalens]|uniref:Probable 2-phosphosulfolactate phosphatase n=1 Tax=Halanaerobium praevalens (strain ATCC 33744 / DSM 2228 / GSL) TaxID=572479 RepID=E3DPG7_HALPG|nr:2-phosphosulfolactate phosphatase [Halanaerobium praevalens]ADO77729.1 2-phosphosulfolactate phosphatase [Halanaerobium praevalens DSM 2228]